MTDPSGRSYPPTPPVTVTAEHVAAFATAIGTEPGSVVPPTYAIALARPAWEALFGDPDVGIALERTVHAEQVFEHERPLRVGDVLTSTLTLERLRRRAGAIHARIAVELRDADGQLVSTGRSTFLCAEESA